MCENQVDDTIGQHASFAATCSRQDECRPSCVACCFVLIRIQTIEDIQRHRYNLTIVKTLYVVGNWKSNKTIQETKDWFDAFAPRASEIPQHVTVILSPSFTLLPYAKQRIAEANLPIQLAAQNVSPFGPGAYTGEVSASQIAEMAQWTLIGHSERRANFAEETEMLQSKVEQARHAGLRTIFCVQDKAVPVIAGVDIVAYEPIWAIGTGKTDTPENAAGVLGGIKDAHGLPVGIYGGSVKAENVASFVSQPGIDGVLPGGASLDPGEFLSLIKNAASSV